MISELPIPVHWINLIHPLIQLTSESLQAMLFGTRLLPLSRPKPAISSVQFSTISTWQHQFAKKISLPVESTREKFQRKPQDCRIEAESSALKGVLQYGYIGIERVCSIEKPFSYKLGRSSIYSNVLLYIFNCSPALYISQVYISAFFIFHPLACQRMPQLEQLEQLELLFLQRGQKSREGKRYKKIRKLMERCIRSVYMSMGLYRRGICPVENLSDTEQGQTGREVHLKFSYQASYQTPYTLAIRAARKYRPLQIRTRRIESVFVGFESEARLEHSNTHLSLAQFRSCVCRIRLPIPGRNSG